MPGPAQQNGFDAGKFAAYVASFTSNPNEAEAMNGARMFRREAARNGGGRVVDLFYRADVMAALDVQLKPEREESPELSAARQMAIDQCALAKEALAKAEHWAEIAKRQEAAIEELRRQTPTTGDTARVARASSSPTAVPVPEFGYVAGFFAFAVVMAGAALVFTCAARIAAAVFGGG